MLKHYTKAPLPFVGQKRNFIKLFKEVLENVPQDGAGWTIIDVFGGSGLLAHIAKHEKPAARVIYNDFDSYAERLKNIDATNKLRDKIEQILGDYPRDKLISEPKRQAIIETIQANNEQIDLRSLCSWLLFSGKTTEVDTLEKLLKQSFYNCLRKSPIPAVDGYLDGLEIVR